MNKVSTETILPDFYRVCRNLYFASPPSRWGRTKY